MLPILLVASIAVALPQDATLLEHATKHETTLGPTDPVLEGIGPYKVFRYRLDADDSTLFVWAQSGEADLILHGRFTEPTPGSDGSSSDAAALVGGEERASVFVDDDTGGGTTPLLILPHEGGGTLRIRVTAKSTSNEVPITIHCFEARETDATRAAVEEAAPEVEAIEAAVAAKELERARQLTGSLVEKLLEVDGAAASRGINVLLWNVGISAFRASSLETTSRAWSAALAFRQKTLPPDHRDIHIAMLNLAVVLQRQGQLQQAYELKRSVLESRERLLPPEHPDRLKAQMNVASALFAMQDLEGARDLFEDTLAIQARSLPADDPSLLVTKQNLAAVLTELGDVRAAHPIIEEVHTAQARRLPEDHPTLLAAKQNLAGLRLALRDIAGARELFETVLAIKTRILPAGHPDLLTAQSNLAAIYQQLEQHEKALEMFQAIHAARQRILPADHPDLLSSKMSLARAYAELGGHDQALELTLAVYEARLERLPANHPDLVSTMQSLSARFKDCGDPEGSLKLARQVRDAQEVILPNGHPDLTAARENLVPMLVRRGEIEEARQLLNTILEGRLVHADQLRTSPPRLARDIAFWQLKMYGWLVYWCQETTTPDSDPFEPMLFEVLESLRAVAMGSEEIAWASARSPELSELRSRLTEVGSELSSLVLAAPKTSEPVEGWRKRIFALSNQRDQIQRELLSRLASRGLVVDRPTITRVAEGLSEDSGLVSYFNYYDYPGRDPETGEWLPFVESVLAFVVRPDASVELVKLGATEPIREQLTRWRESLGHPIESRGVTGVRGRESVSAEAAHGTTLSRLVLEPVLARLPEVKTLHLILDDFLHLLPFEALPGGDSRVLDRLRVHYEPTALHLLRGPRELKGPPRLVAFGGVDYDGMPRDSFENPLLEPMPPPIAVADSSERERGAAFGALGPLKETAIEVDSLARLYEQHFDSEALVLKGRSASKETLFREARTARWLHIATHGWFVPETVSSSSEEEAANEAAKGSSLTRAESTVRGFAPQTLCGIALAGANRGADEHGAVPGMVTAEELATLDLSNCELAVLSACETNVGVRRAGQGIQSLQTALHAAGAEAAITSLWQVDDAATRRLFEIFYTALWEEGLGKVDALVQAKQTLREEGHPVRDWAGWVLTGDPD
ncbi:MAG: CHAT domain-containing tetratricopeptide repeat protein [Planctomycetota bacterium]